MASCSRYLATVRRAMSICVAFAQELDELLVRIGVLGVLFTDELLDQSLDRLAGDVVGAILAIDAGIEEVLQLEQPLGCARTCCWWRG